MHNPCFATHSVQNDAKMIDGDVDNDHEDDENCHDPNENDDEDFND